jgi:hypothetical protein
MSTFIPLSDDLKAQLETALQKINVITLVNNQKIKEFRQKSPLMSEDVQSLATIVSAQVLVLEEKYKLMYDLLIDLHQRVETYSKELKND